MWKRVLSFRAETVTAMAMAMCGSFHMLFINMSHDLSRMHSPGCSMEFFWIMTHLMFGDVGSHAIISKQQKCNTHIDLCWGEKKRAIWKTPAIKHLMKNWMKYEFYEFEGFDCQKREWEEANTVSETKMDAHLWLHWIRDIWLIVHGMQSLFVIIDRNIEEKSSSFILRFYTRRPRKTNKR